MTLTRLVYFSERNPAAPMVVGDMIAIGRERNAASHLTGFLYHNGMSFLHILEGGRLEVSQKFQEIAKDRRHRNVILIGAAEARERVFTDPLGGVEGSDADIAQVLLRYLPHPRIDPETLSHDAAVDILQDIAVAVES